MSPAAHPPGALHYTVENGVAHIVIDNPARRNAISLGMWRQLSDLADRCGSDDAVKCVVIAGKAGGGFAAGADISEFDTHRSGDAVSVYDATSKGALQRLINLAKPSIAAIDGHCIGAGISLALSCDLRLASAGAQFALPAARLGLGYEFDSLQRLVDEVGVGAARWMVFTGARFDAVRAERFGLVHERVEGCAETVAQAAAVLAGQIACNAPLTIRAAKSTIAARDGSEQRRRIALDAIAACFTSEDYAEGQRAFVAKRLPLFRGR